MKSTFEVTPSRVESTNRAGRPGPALLFICISLLVISLDNTILNVALPSISTELGASASQLQWLVDAYVLVFASLLLTIGSVGDRVGRKRLLQLGLGLFGAGSLAAALAPSTDALIASRAFLGIGAATIMPGTLSLITATFRGERARARAIAIWAAVFGLGHAIGPVAGGWLLERFHWSSIFLINLPIVALAIAGGHFFVIESKDPNVRRLDLPGVVLSIAGLVALVYGIIEAGNVGWTAQNVLIAYAVAALLLGIFAWWESRSPHAMLPLHFFGNRSFSGANLALVGIMFANTASIFFLTQYFQSVQGYSPLDTGLLILPMALVSTLGSGLSARLADRLGVKLAVGAGTLLAALGLLAASQVLRVASAYTDILPALSLFALGLGVGIPAATNSVMGSVPVDKAGVGSGMNDTTRLLGSALGVAVLGAIMNSVYTGRVAELKASLPAGALPAETQEAIGASIQGAHGVARTLGDAPLAQVIVDAANQAFVSGMTNAMVVGAVILGLASLGTLAILPARVRRPGMQGADNASQDAAAGPGTRDLTPPDASDLNESGHERSGAAA